jgi:hypothetical protein
MNEKITDEQLQATPTGFGQYQTQVPERQPDERQPIRPMTPTEERCLLIIKEHDPSAIRFEFCGRRWLVAYPCGDGLTYRKDITFEPEVKNLIYLAYE